jgi:hypothetical protein
VKPNLILAGIVLTCAMSTRSAQASPTSQILVPSTDIQKFLKPRLDIDNFFRGSGNPEATPYPGASRDANVFDLGLTVGVLPYQKLQMELGCDYLVTANDPNDQHPWSGSLKLATPEGSLFDQSPALALGLFNARPVKDVATSDAPSVVSGQNIFYGLLAKTVPALGGLPALGRFSTGYYRGSRRALVDSSGRPDNTGLLLSWDRVFGEISDRLWVGVDYFGGHNSNGAVSMAFSWAFTDNVSLLFGYNMYAHTNLAGSNTFTTQASFCFPR